MSSQGADVVGQHIDRHARQISRTRLLHFVVIEHVFERNAAVGQNPPLPTAVRTIPRNRGGRNPEPPSARPCRCFGRTAYAGAVPLQPAHLAPPRTGAQRFADRVVDAVLVAARAIGRPIAGPLRRPLGRAWNATANALRLRPDVLTRPSAVGMRRLAIAGLAANCFIVVSGGLVRLTESGLGCPTWPRCTPDSLLPSAHTGVPVAQMAIEFGNRMVTFGVLAVGVLVFIAAVHLREQRPDLTRLAVVQPIGVLAQGALGGVTVLTQLHPAAVGTHYLLSALVLVACVALVARVGEGDQPPSPVGELTTRAARALPYAGFVLLAAGTVVTGAGPHAGDEDAQRYDFFGADTITVAAGVHSLTMWATVALVIALLVLLRRERPRDPVGLVRLQRRTYVLAAVIAAQGAIGYVQYLTGVPTWLVFLHIAGSVAFWVTVLFVRFAARTRG